MATQPDQRINTAIALTARLVSPEQLLAGFFSLYPNVSPTTAMFPKPADKLKQAFGEQLKDIPANVIALVVPKIGTAAGRKELIATYGADLLEAYPPAKIVEALKEVKDDGMPRYDYWHRRKFLEVAIRHNAGELVAEILKSGEVGATMVDGRVKGNNGAYNLANWKPSALVWHAMRTNSDKSLKAIADHYGIDEVAALGIIDNEAPRAPAYKGITDVGILTYKKDTDGNPVGHPIGNVSFNQQQIHTALARATGRSMLSLSSPKSQGELESVLQRAQDAGVLTPAMLERLAGVELVPHGEGRRAEGLLTDGKYPVAVDSRIDQAELAASAAIINRSARDLEKMPAVDVTKLVTAALYAAADKPAAKR